MIKKDKKVYKFPSGHAIDGDDLSHSLFESDEEDGSTSGGVGGGKIEFRYKDPYAISPRDDQLPIEEIKRLLVVHKEQHKGNVDKQKITRKERKAFKEGKGLSQQMGHGYGQGLGHPFKTHPIAAKAQFSGIDKQVTHLPNQNEANTNPELQDKLENRLQLRLSQRAQPTFNPKPRPG